MVAQQCVVKNTFTSPVWMTMRNEVQQHTKLDVAGTRRSALFVEWSVVCEDFPGPNLDIGFRDLRIFVPHGRSSTEFGHARVILWDVADRRVGNGLGSKNRLHNYLGEEIGLFYCRALFSQVTRRLRTSNVFCVCHFCRLPSWVSSVQWRQNFCISARTKASSAPRSA